MIVLAIDFILVGREVISLEGAYDLDSVASFILGHFKGIPDNVIDAEVRSIPQSSCPSLTGNSCLWILMITVSPRKAFCVLLGPPLMIP